MDSKVRAIHELDGLLAESYTEVNHFAGRAPGALDSEQIFVLLKKLNVSVEKNSKFFDEEENQALRNAYFFLHNIRNMGSSPQDVDPKLSSSDAYGIARRLLKGELEKTEKKPNVSIRQKMHGKNVAGTQVGVNHGIVYANNVNAPTTYHVEKVDFRNLESVSVFLTRRYSDQKLSVVGGIGLIADLISIFVGFKSVFDLNNMLAWVPSVPKDIGNILIVVGIVTLPIFAIILNAVRYKHESKCPSCLKYYVREETGDPVRTETKVKGGTQVSTLRSYFCKECKHQWTKRYSDFIEDEPSAPKSALADF